MQRWTHRARYAGVSAALALALIGVGAACDDDDGEDRPGSVSVIEDGSASGSTSGSVSGSVSGVSGVSGSSTVSGVGPGTVSPAPDGATEVAVTLAEWSVTPQVTTAAGPLIYFLAENVGPADPHELVIVRSDAPVEELPTDERGFVPEDEVDFIGEVEAFAPGTSASGTFELEPGRYILFCNIVEFEDGEWESHYLEGMRVAFTVE